LEREPRTAQTGPLNVGIAAIAVISLLGGIVASGQMIALAGRWYHALTVLVYTNLGG
jgi:hypothetical protein